MITNDEQITAFRKDLKNWYSLCGRDLPWRHTKDPYRIWISEIMLQQTQVETVKTYYERFVSYFPAVTDLANAHIDEVYKLWEGLGYYRRALHMHEAAIMIRDDYAGTFPSTYETILSLKGIGAYTASAISSIAFNIPKGVVDGNTLRIISRLYNRQDNIAQDRTKKAYQEIMDQLIDPGKPSDFNQAMMDLGAMICTPRKPACEACPVRAHCEAYEKGTCEILPVNNKPRKKDEIELITAVLEYQGKYVMVQGKEGLLSGLYGLIQYEASSPAAFEEMFYDQYHIDVQLHQFAKMVKHVFTHKVWLMNSYYGKVYDGADVDFSAYPEIKLCTKEELSELAISTAHKKVLQLFEL